jgi:hypothetical protein
MHHHRLVLNGPPAAVARLAGALCDAGAVAVAANAGSPPRLIWTTPAPAPLPELCARHPRVVVGAERFASLGDALERLILHGAETTVLQRRVLTPQPGADPDPLAGLCLDGDCAPLERAALHAAARRVAARPADLGPGLAGTSLDDALLVGAAVGHVCVEATTAPEVPAHALAADPHAGDVAEPAVLDAIATLAATTLTASAAATGPACSAELEHERAWRLTVATALATSEVLWSRPGDADWPEWLMYVLAGAAGLVEDCAACLHQPPPPYVSVHAEHHATDEERLQHAATRLVATCLQTLVLFDRGPWPC